MDFFQLPVQKKKVLVQVVTAAGPPPRNLTNSPHPLTPAPPCTYAVRTSQQFQSFSKIAAPCASGATRAREGIVEKSWVCSVPHCPFATRTKSNFDQHVLTHGELKTYTCSENSCFYSAKLRPSLRTRGATTGA